MAKGFHSYDDAMTDVAFPRRKVRVEMYASSMPQDRALFRKYPVLAERLPWISLGKFPTPVERLQRLERAVESHRDLWVKRDDLTGTIYGSNKVRKLEFLLGETLARKKQRIVLGGALGSNYVVASLLYAKRVGLQGTSVLFPQPLTPRAMRNFRSTLSLSDSVFFTPSAPLLPMGMALAALQALERDGRFPDVSPLGGSSVLGTLGCVDGILELREQIDRGEIPEPALIVAALGTCGTVAGLLVGAQLAQLRSQIVAVRVVEAPVANAWRTRRLVRRTRALLRRLGCPISSRAYGAPSLAVAKEYLGKGYAYWTREGMDAVALMGESEGIKLEGTYTGKALACVLRRARQGRGEGPVLFWNTYSAVEPPHPLPEDELKKKPHLQRILSRCPEGSEGNG